jgi:hypothetical protein
MSESENSRAENLGKVVGNRTDKSWSKAAGYGLVARFLGLGANDKFANRGRMKTPQEWDNEIRAHELKTDINHHYGTKRAEGDLDREQRHLANVLATTPEGRAIQRSERDGRGGYKVHYGAGEKPAAPAAEEEKKKPTARRAARKPADKPAAEKKPTARRTTKAPAAKPAADKKPATRAPRAKAAPKKENPGMNYFSEEKYP